MKRVLVAVLASPLLLLAGCATQKTSNPLSPTVAGPMEGVDITAPNLLIPGNSAEISGNSQPLTLTIENSATNSPRPLTYSFQLASDVAFNNVVFSRDDVAPGPDGRTSLRLPDAVTSGRVYFWRARAQDGANTGPYSTPVAFNLFTPVAFEKPTPLSPVGNQLLTSLSTEFRFRNAPHVGNPVNVSYLLELATNDTFANKILVWQLDETPNETKFTSGNLPPGTQIFWHVRAYETSTGPWSDTAVFRTPVPVVAPPPSTGTPGSPCGPPYPSAGPVIVACVERQYPEKIAPVGSLHERDANMAFLRDRVIETGICGGLDLAQNRKQSGAMSIDAIVYRHGGIDDVIDIGFQYDSPEQVLHLQWITVNGPAGYTPIPRPTCR